MTEDEIIYKLWALLDRIDTLDDACRANDEAFRQLVRSVQRERFSVCPERYVDALYAKYHPQP